MALHISLAAEHIGTFYGLPITNSYLTTLIVMALLAGLSYMATRKMSMIPGNAQLIAESIVGGLYDFFSAIAGKHIKQFFPLVASLFIFILVANWIGLLPGVGTIGFRETAEVKTESVAPHDDAAQITPAVVDDHATAPIKDEIHDEATTPAAGVAESGSHGGEAKFVPLFRAATADLNLTLALAIISVLAMQYFGFKTLGAHYAGRFINFKDPIMFGIGIMEFVSDISKVVSFAFRLFGNIFAGEVLLAVLAFLIPFVVPLPFLFMELFVGVVQALVFSMLSTAFFNVAVSHGEEEHAEAAHA